MWRAMCSVCPGSQHCAWSGWLGLGLLVLIVVLRGDLMAQSHAAVRAPEFPEGMQWLNTTRPLRLADLRGKVVLLDFWTYCCINCMHIIPDLTALEQQYATELVVIGVHSAKFPNEGEADNIRQAILRYEIQHPVVNDRDFRIWRAYAVRAWPTLMVIRPDGYVLGHLAGEGNMAVLQRVIEEVLAEARSRGTLNDTPLHFALAKDQHVSDALAFPGKVLADAPSQRLCIADSNHNRIVIADLEGKVVAVAGSGAIGKADGDFATATFHHPQGMALDGHILYVADTENHLLRRLDLLARTVTTIAGTGAQARTFNVPGTGTQVALNSPWDLTRIGTQLFIAMAGPHQVWVMHLDTAYLEPYAGSSREDIIDAPRRQAAMAQPSGISTDGTLLYVADSETSAIRSISLGINGMVKTIVGAGLFEFGDQDGIGPEQVRLQHPLGVAYYANLLYVADTYNHKIKTIGPATATSMTYLGTGKPGRRDGQAPEFYEPGGLSIAAGKLYIADTNNHAIRVADLSTGTVTTLALRGLAAPTAVAGFSATNVGPEEVIAVAPQRVKADATGTILINLQFPEGYHLNPRAPLSYSVSVSGVGIRIAEADRTGQAMAPSLPLAIPFQAAAGLHQATADIDMTFYYCREDDTGVCVMQSVRWQVPLHTDPEASTSEAVVSYQAEAPVVQKQL
jgi:thiol-disulfide isomerase/thioredoxin/DNA-binding beta-propeller fold protein YncE